MTRTDIPYSAKEVIEVLGIGNSTLRKWSLALEEHNYNFIRTDQNKRMFTDKDLVILKQFQMLVQRKNLSINNAAEVIANKYNKDSDVVFSNETEVERTSETPLSFKTLQEQYLSTNETVKELKTDVEQLKTMNRELLQALQEQNNYIKENLERRDQQLIESIRESQETKKLLLEAKEQQEQEKKPRKGIFRWLSRD
ncbi:MerR family transcriptional regulator [Bacillus spongiae]|uniref:MerR family transcriptional regulator n=1 Tax=Bacillus spongiae TaxID=2683610 RepID=A0ABU8HJV4_9BACI